MKINEIISESIIDLFDSITFSESMPNKEYGDANVADVAEAVFAAASCALMINRGRKITEADVLQTLKTVIETPPLAVWKFQDDDGKSTDEIRCRINIPQLAMDVAKNIDMYKDKRSLREIINSSIQFVNNDRRLNAYAKILFSNNKNDLIEIYADGTLNQSGTKIDIFVIVNGKPTKANVSLKVGSNKLGNFDRGSPLNFDTHMGPLFKELLGITPPDVRDLYNEKMSEYQRVRDNEVFTSKDRADPRILNALKGFREAIGIAILAASKILNEKLQDQSFKDDFINKIVSSATKGDNTVSVIDLKSNQRNRYSNLSSKLSRMKFTVDVKSQHTAATLVFSADGRPIVQVRPQIQTNFDSKMKVKPRVIWVMETLPYIKELTKTRH